MLKSLRPLIAILVCFSSFRSLPAHEDASSPDHHHETVMTTRPQSKVIPPPKSDDVFHFVVYGDRTGGVPAGLKVLEQAVKDTNLLDPDLVMTVGDLIQGYNDAPEWMRQMKEFQAIMNDLNMKWYPVAGNHDIYWRGAGPTPAGHHEANYEKHFGPLWYSFQHKNAGFIVLYSDEGDPKTNRKSFSEGALQNMSEEQLAFLEKALTQHKALDHVFVFLHHPRWIGAGYTGSNWDRVHEKMAKAGNVSAVFAGHIHQMRYDGKRDGIEYYALATTGGALNADIPDAGFLHHLNLVTVRKDRVSVAALPIGAVMDPKQFTPEFLQEVGAARRIRLIQKSPEIILQANGAARGQAVFEVENTSPRPIDVTVSIDPRSVSLGWRTTLEHQHFEIPAGDRRSIQFEVARNALDPDQASVPSLQMEIDYLAKNARVRLPNAITPIGMQLGEVPADFFDNAVPHYLRVEEPQNAIQIPSKQIRLPDGPITLEAWVQPTSSLGYRGIVAKTEVSEFAIFSDEGVPEFSVYLDGEYHTAKGSTPMPLNEWTHLAGVYDDTAGAVHLFVNGKHAGTKPASGKRKTNKLPLYIGADPNASGQPSRNFTGGIDEVRLSNVVRYSQPFDPASVHKPDDKTVLLYHLDRTVGPFVLNHGPGASHGVLGPTSRLIQRNP